jgi:hypothetical protein
MGCVLGSIADNFFQQPPQPRPRTFAQHAEEDEKSLKAAKSILIGAALIATITYATWVLLLFTDVTNHKAIKVFCVCNSLAFYLAITTVWLCQWAVWPYDEKIIRPFDTIKQRIRLPAFFFGLSYICVLVAYSSGAYIRVPKETLGFLIADGFILGTIVVGVVLCVMVIALTLLLAYFG